MLTTLALALSLSASAQPTDVSTGLAFRIAPADNLEIFYRVLDTSGRELTDPESAYGTIPVHDAQEPDRVDVRIPRTKVDGRQPLKRIVVLEIRCALSVMVVVDNLKPGKNYLRETIPVVYGDIAPQFDKNGKPIRTDDAVDEQDLKMVEDFVREGKSGMNPKYHGLPWMFADVNFDGELDAKDVAIVKANLGKVAPKVGPLGKMKPAPKVYVATQRRPR
ncbi:MAG: hypothetical protein KIS66_16175 [Fimbriimonadaceae bacterium]|nr:hypothetical protein [Fimbriimonadaceae bacterium]